MIQIILDPTVLSSMFADISAMSERSAAHEKIVRHFADLFDEFDTGLFNLEKHGTGDGDITILKIAPGPDLTGFVNNLATDRPRQYGFRALSPNEIKDALRKAGTSQKSIHTKLGISPQAVSKVIYGESASENVMRAVAEAIGRNPARIWPASFDDDGNFRRQPAK